MKGGPLPAAVALRMLCDASAELDQLGDGPAGPLQLAAGHGQQQVVETLLKRGTLGLQMFRFFASLHAWMILFKGYRPDAADPF